MICLIRCNVTDYTFRKLVPFKHRGGIFYRTINLETNNKSPSVQIGLSTHEFTAQANIAQTTFQFMLLYSRKQRVGVTFASYSIIKWNNLQLFKINEPWKLLKLLEVCPILLSVRKLKTSSDSSLFRSAHKRCHHSEINQTTILTSSHKECRLFFVHLKRRNNAYLVLVYLGLLSFYWAFLIHDL